MIPLYAPVRHPKALENRAFSILKLSALRFLALSFFCLRCTFFLHDGQYFCRLEFGVKAAPHSAQ